MKNILVAIFAIFFCTNILNADTHSTFRDRDVRLCRSISFTFEGMDAEILENCLYETQTILSIHPCAEGESTFTCLFTSCEIEGTVENYTKEQAQCLVKHLWVEEDAQLREAAAALTLKIIAEKSK